MRIKVLVAEDHAATQRMLYRVLTKAGYEVDMAGDGNELVEKWKQGKHRVVVADMDMPGKNGLDACREIKHLDHKVKIVIITGLAYLTPNLIEDLGFESCLIKPFRNEELLQRLPKPKIWGW